MPDGIPTKQPEMPATVMSFGSWFQIYRYWRIERIGTKSHHLS
jgi:hypothetical protein